MPRALPTLRIRLTWMWPAILAALVVVLLAAAASAAIETNTVGSFWRGLWWSVSLITTVGFVGEPPETTAGAVLSALLMLVGFALLAMVSASLAALFVREEEHPREVREVASDRAILLALRELDARLAAIERQLPAAGRRDETASPDDAG